MKTWRLQAQPWRGGAAALVLVLGVGVAGAADPAPAGLTVANHSVIERVWPGKYAPPGGAPAAIRLVGVRNGAFAGQVVVSSRAPVKGLKAVPSDLTGPGKIPAEAVCVRYGVLDGPPQKRGEMGYVDSLESHPPEEVKVLAGRRAVQPIWVTVTVPPDAKPGEYSGALTLSAEGTGAVRVPLSLTVIEWTLPDANDFAGRMDVVQSPESVALAYDVELWSEQHLKLLEKTFSLLKPLADKTIYLSAIRRTHFGNEHAMVRWYRDAQGQLQPNFEHVEKYLDVAVKHLGKIPGAILLCWEPVSSMGHAGGAGGAERTHDKPIQYTLWDPKSGKLQKRTGPAWGTPEARAFWKKVTDGIQPVLAKRGLEKSLMFGLIGDARPTKIAMQDIAHGVANPRWAVHSHHYCNEWQGYEIGMCCALWGIHLNIVDPQKGGSFYGYGWLNPFWLAYYPREFSLQSPLVEHRFKLEMWMGAYSLHEVRYQGRSRTACGLGRIGGDFWTVLKDSRGNARYSLAGRYPESYWGQLNLNYCIPHILAKGRDGPLPTVRSEAFREGVQDLEARVFIEKAIVMRDRRTKIGEDLARRCREMLDERIFMVNRAGGVRQDLQTGITTGPTIAPDWEQKRQTLFRTAAEVAAKLGS